MEPFVTMGLVLKETRYREADRILTILTPKLGVITAMAANSLRLKSKLFSACGQPMCRTSSMAFPPPLKG